jgi:hypothetical protein
VLLRMASSDPLLSARARALYRRVYGAEPPPYTPVPPEPADLPPEEPDRDAQTREKLPPGDPTRVIYGPTAFTRPPGVIGFNAFELGSGTLDFGVSENLQLGVQSAIPIGFLALGGLIKLGVKFKGGAVGLRGNALVIKPLADVEAILLYGAGPILTIGDYENYFNFSVPFYGVTVEGSSAGLALPNLGGSIRVSGATRLSAELFLPAGLGDQADLALGDFMALLWGVRVFGDNVWGDIALLDPICDGCAEIYQYIPLGIPFLNFGGNW